MSRTMLSPLFTWRSAICDSDLPPTQRHVALTLSMHMSERGDSCYPSQKTLARETGLSERCVREAIAGLVESGWLSVERERAEGGVWKVNRYTATTGTTFRSEDPPEAPGSSGDQRHQVPLRASGNRNGNLNTTEPPRTSSSVGARAQNPLWDVLVEIFGDPQTRSERTHFGAVVRELREARAEPEQVRQRATEAWRRWQAPFTPQALAKHWTSLGKGSPVKTVEPRGYDALRSFMSKHRGGS